MEETAYKSDVAFSLSAEDEPLATELNDLLQDRLETFVWTGGRLSNYKFLHRAGQGRASRFWCKIFEVPAILQSRYFVRLPALRSKPRAHLYL